jgi:hypothetical protein
VQTRPPPVQLGVLEKREGDFFGFQRLCVNSAALCDVWFQRLCVMFGFQRLCVNSAALCDVWFQWLFSAALALRVISRDLPDNIADGGKFHPEGISDLSAGKLHLVI